MANKLLDFSGQEYKVPPPNGSSMGQPVDKNYHISAIIDDAKRLKLYFKDPVPVGICPGDCLLTVRVVDANIRVHLFLEDLSWTFRHDPSVVVPATSYDNDAMTLGVNTPSQYYSNLQHYDSTHISFDVLKAPASTSGDPHHFNLYILLDEGTGRTTLLPIKIDPDVKNPGDPPPTVPPDAA